MRISLWDDVPDHHIDPPKEYWEQFDVDYEPEDDGWGNEYEADTDY